MTSFADDLHNDLEYLAAIEGKEEMTTGRNRYALTIDVELTVPLEGDYAKAAAELLASDIQAFLKSEDWGYGRARIESVYAPSRQFEHGDYYAPEPKLA